MPMPQPNTMNTRAIWRMEASASMRLRRKRATENVKVPNTMGRRVPTLSDSQPLMGEMITDGMAIRAMSIPTAVDDNCIPLISKKGAKVGPATLENI